jgi:ATP-dependent Clp protease ATP-binding subunit ClpC
MTELTTLTTEQVTALDDRSRRVCVVYRDQRLPVGCTPDRADIGVETGPGLGVSLLLPPGIEYSGSDSDAAAWVTTGRHVENQLSQALAWLADVLAQPQESGAPDGVSVGHQPVDESTLCGLVAAEVLHQDRATGQISAAVSRHTWKIAPRRPLTLLLTGPTGVGKTASVEALVTALNSLSTTPWAHVRLDMAEMHERHTVARLVGAPPGYVGYGDGQDLASAMRANPRIVILLDEVEKAHPAVVTSLLGLLDAGRLVTRDDTVEARSAVIAMTTNLDADGLYRERTARGIGDPDQIDVLARQRLRAAGLRPELVGRITSVVAFDPLDVQAQHDVARAALRRVAASYGVVLDAVADEAVAAVVKATSGSGAGARGLEYVIDRLYGPDFAGHYRTQGSSPLQLAR